MHSSRCNHWRCSASYAPPLEMSSDSETTTIRVVKLNEHVRECRHCWAINTFSPFKIFLEGLAICDIICSIIKSVFNNIISNIFILLDFHWIVIGPQPLTSILLYLLIYSEATFSLGVFVWCCREWRKSVTVTIVVQCFPDVARRWGDCSLPWRDAAEITSDIHTEWTSPFLSILSGRSCGSNSVAGYMAAYRQHLSVHSLLH